ncbi:MAG: PAS domain S-box protein [Myxococcales bacterium]|nr:PAS domain S-box protein [Myxococcales bacterium]
MDELENLRGRIAELEARAAEQSKLDAALRERLESVARNAPDYVIEMDRAGVITYMNRPAPGRTLTDMLGSNVEVWMEPEARPAFARTLAHVFERGEPASYESVGAVSGRAYINRVGPVLEDGKVTRAILITHDVTELKAAETRLRESEGWFRTLVDGYFDALAVSEQGRIIEVNAASEKLFGYGPGEMIGLTPAALTTPEGAAIVMEHIKRGDESAYEVPGKRRDGSTFPGEVHARNVSYRGRPARLSFFRDLSEQHRARDERQRLEQKMLDAQKLETLGVLAGGIAHDFNNLLQVMLGNVELATLELGSHPAQAGVRRSLDQAREAALRASEIVHQMLAYSGQGPRSMAAIAVSDVVREIAELLLVSISKNTEITLELPDGLPTTFADPSQLRQVIMNLITNASEALGGQSGKVRLRVGRAALGPSDAPDLAVLPAELPPDAVFIEVDDDGVGIREDVVRRIFDPFYSTKFPGRGLGLSSVAGIVRAHGGAIRVRSVPGHGSTFTVYLPVATGSAANRAPALAPPEPLPAKLDARVLFADDEPRLLELVARSLRAAGLTLTTARDGLEALEALQADPGGFDVVILDLTMPRLGGAEALRKMRALRADLPAVLLSGYSETDIAGDLSRGPTRFLAKPFLSSALLECLAELLQPA